MKKYIACIVALVFLSGTVCAEAKSAKKTSRSEKSKSSVVITDTFPDGYPNVIGHTYTKTEEGVKMVLSFINNENARLTLSKGKMSETFDVVWTYDGDGYLMVNSIDNSDILLLYIGDDGRKLYLANDYGDVMWNYGPLKIVK